MDTKNKIIDIVKQAIDLHVHIGPELIPRKYTVPTIIIAEEGNIKGMALKNHFFSTVPFIAEQPISKLRLIGSVALNSFVGGLNPDAVYAASTLANGPFIVWFPTVSAKQFLDTSVWEIAPEWIGKKTTMSRRAKDINGITLFDKNADLTEQTRNVLFAIKKTNAILATGHLSWQESQALVKEAVTIGIKKIILTHCIYKRIAMPITVQKELVALGAKVEHCFSMYSIDKIPIKDIAREIKEVGAENCILSSDVGQIFSPPPSEALLQFGLLLQKEGITMSELKTMLAKNPNELIA